MSGNVYHRLTQNDQFSTKVMAWPSVIWQSGTYGIRSNVGDVSGSLSLYGGIRSRSDVFSGSASGLQIYPLDEVDTYSIDRVIQVAGSYPATGSINYVVCTNTQPSSYITDITDARWYDTHWAVISGLYLWYHDHFSSSPAGNYTLLGSELVVIHIPSMYYGSSIATGTVKIIDYSGGGAISPTVMVDNGVGGIVVPASLYPLNEQIIGHVFYNEGLIVFGSGTSRDNSGGLYPWSIGNGPLSLSGTKLQLQFSGTQSIITKTFMCRIHPSECNCSHNSTWSTRSDDGNLRRIGIDNTTYITTVGLYNEDYELVAVARVAQPIRKREKDSLDIRLRLDF